MGNARLRGHDLPPSPDPAMVSGLHSMALFLNLLVYRALRSTPPPSGQPYFAPDPLQSTPCSPPRPTPISVTPPKLPIWKPYPLK